MESPAAHPTSSSLLLAPGRWLLDGTHSSVVFAVRHLGLSKVRGRFDDVEATLEIGDSADDIRVSATIELASVNTNNLDRDKHLRSTDFFNCDANPLMTFESTLVRGAGESWTLEGDLSMNGVTRPVALPIVFNGVQPLGQVPHAGFEATGQLKRSDYGLDFGLSSAVGTIVVADTITYELDLQFIEDNQS